MQTTNQSQDLSEDKLNHQINLIHIAEQYGYSRNENVREVARALLNNLLTEDHDIHAPLLRFKHIQGIFIKHLEKTLKPLLYGISRKWRKTQYEFLSAMLQSLNRGYVRPLSEIPTGGGKSMVIGAIVRASLDTMKELHLNSEIHIFTSRIAIAGQLIYEEIPSEETHDRPLEVGKKGDVRLWCSELPEDSIRLLAGSRGQSIRELEKDSVLTISTYQGLRAKRISGHFKKVPFIVICDESHRVTERITMLLEEMKAMTIGVSATVLGPDRDPFTFFERIERPQLPEKKKTYIDYLCYHKSIAEMIKDQELKPVRWINAKGIRINVSDAELRGKKGMYDVFNDMSVARILSRNPELGAEVISEAYLGDHIGLTLTGSKPIHQRRGIVFVDRVETAKVCSKLCNETLSQKLKGKYGDIVYFKAAYVDGTMKEAVYNAIIEDFRAGKITLLFSAEKIGEGVDLPFVNLIIPLRVLGFGSQWKLVQGLGRGIRVDPSDPFGDLVVVDMVFESDRHLLASVLGIFGRSSILSGGLLAGWGSSYELEKKVFDLLKKCKSWTEIWGNLSPDEQLLFPFIKEKVFEEKNRSRTGIGLEVGGAKALEGKLFSLQSIDFIEQDDVRLALSLGNPEEMLRYTVETLLQERYDSIFKLIGIRDHTLHLFAHRRFGRFRDGITMVSLNLQKNIQTLTVADMTEFIDLMRKGGIPEGKMNIRRDDPLIIQSKPIINPKPMHEGRSYGVKKRTINTMIEKQKKVEVYKNSFDLLLDLTRNLFGVEPEITVNFRDLHKDPFFAAQSTIALPEGLKFCSTIRRNVDKVVATQGCAAELEKIISEQIRKNQILLYRGSPLYKNYLKVLQLIIYENKFSDTYYTITERSGIFVVQAKIEKYKMEFTGTPAVHPDEKVAKQHAEVMLARDLTKTLPTFADSANVYIGRTNIEKLEKFCGLMKIQLHRTNKTIQVKNSSLHEVTFTAMRISQTGLGISPEQARERAAENLYLKLKELAGGRQDN